MKERDPSLADELAQLRAEHLAYEMTWCRLRYHPRLVKVSTGVKGGMEGTLRENAKGGEERMDVRKERKGKKRE